MNHHPEKIKKLHGNHAAINPCKHVDSMYQNNLVTVHDHCENETPIVDEKNVRYARKFVEENKK